MMSYIDIMESISENLQKKNCSSCGCLRELAEFGPNGRNGCFKTCQKCRENKKRSREKKANSIQSQRANPVLTLDDYVRDGWAGMTAELLEPLTYEERCDIYIYIYIYIYINKDIVVSRLNIFLYVKILSGIVAPTPPYLLRKPALLKLEPLWGPRLLRCI